MTDICVTVISEETFDARSAQSECVDPLRVQVRFTGLTNGPKKVGWTLNMENLGTMLLCLLL